MPGNEYREIIEELREIKRLLNGGDEPAKGIIVRLDRVEQRLALGAGIVGYPKSIHFIVPLSK